MVLFAPPDYRGQVAPTAEPSIVVKDGARYLRQPIELTGDARPCTQLVIWLVWRYRSALSRLAPRATRTARVWVARAAR